MFFYYKKRQLFSVSSQRVLTETFPVNYKFNKENVSNLCLFFKILTGTHYAS